MTDKKLKKELAEKKRVEALQKFVESKKQDPESDDDESDDESDNSEEEVPLAATGGNKA